MILEEFYLSDPGNLEKACHLTGLDEGEVLEIVGGYFTKQSRWSGKPKGKITVSENFIFLKKSFGGKTLWKTKNPDYQEIDNFYW